MLNTFEQIRSYVVKIPKGKVSTYGEIARAAGIKNSRLVGFALHQNTDSKKCPCHRVVKKDGGLATGYAFGGLEAQKDLLLSEGAKFLPDGRVDLESSGFSLD